jgi:hypothetical protein
MIEIGAFWDDVANLYQAMITINGVRYVHPTAEGQHVRVIERAETALRAREDALAANLVANGWVETP